MAPGITADYVLTGVVRERPPLRRLRAVTNLGVPTEPTPRPGSWADGSVENEMKDSSFFYRRPTNRDGGLPPRRPFRWLARRLLRKK